MSSRQELEAALSATAERLTPGSGVNAVRHFKNEIAMITSSSDDLIRRYAGDAVQIASPAVFESKQPDGDPVTIGKGRDGLIVVYPEGLVFVRGVAFGARESKGFAATDVAVERVTTVLNGTEVPGLRIVGRHGKPRIALAITQGQQADVAAEQEAVRDEILRRLAR